MSARRGNPSPSLGCCSLVPEIMLLAGIMALLMLLDAMAGVDTWLAHGQWMPPAPNALIGGWQLVTHAATPPSPGQPRPVRSPLRELCTG